MHYNVVIFFHVSKHLSLRVEAVSYQVPEDQMRLLISNFETRHGLAVLFTILRKLNTHLLLNGAFEKHSCSDEEAFGRPLFNSSFEVCS